ncbi:MAG TPA: phosphate ABC transporter permease subunit PstC [Solirubrobacterales bacterium]|nr:phosphate ABC transporter permease subunit PstC [Solirubrobacterales bacterium]
MSATPPAGSASLKLARSNRQSDSRKRADRVGDLSLRLICTAAAVLAAIVLILIAKEVIEGAQPAFAKYGLSFITHEEWAPPLEVFGGKGLILGTLITSAMALAIGAPVAISIAIFLALLAPDGVRNVVSPLVEMLAAVPSVILGFWGLLILGPFLAGTVEPFLHEWLGFIPLFGTPQTTGASIFNAGLILTIMVIPIIASVSRDLFMAVPSDLQDGAAALGSTRWEVIRGVVLPTTLSGMLAACLLGLGRALGEAIAVSQVVGGGTESHISLFRNGGTMASLIALQFPSAISALHYASLYYLAALLLVIGVAANLAASYVGHRFGGAPAR